VSDRRGQVSALLASTLLLSAFVGAGVVAAFTDAGVLADTNLGTNGNEGDAVAAVEFIAFCPVSVFVDRDDLDDIDPGSVELPPADQPLERLLFPTDPMQTSGMIQWALTFPGEYFVVIGYDGTLEQFSLYEGPDASQLQVGEGIILPAHLSAEQACGPNGFGVTYDFDSETYGVLLPDSLPPELIEQLPEGVDVDDLDSVDLEDFDTMEELMVFLESLDSVGTIES
jgi:hypothetical protein